RSGLSHFEPHSARVHDGAWFGVVVVLGAALVAGLAVALSRWEAGRPLEGSRRRMLERRASLVLGVAVAIAVAGLAFRSGGPSAWWRDFTNPVLVGSGSQRLTSASSNNRWTWWKEAGRVFAKAP